jgi:hypothetical protein
MVPKCSVQNTFQKYLSCLFETVGYFFPARRRRIFSMKKIIALLVVFALFAGSAFAVDLGGAVNGTFTVFQGSSEEDSKVTADASLRRVRIDGSGQTDDGAFGGFFRFDTGLYAGANMPNATSGLAWWKPLDVLKISLGGNPDGHYGKEGVTGWMFSQTGYDTGDVATNSGNIWGGGMYGWNGQSRNAFYGGSGSNALRLEITPLDILAINVQLPVFEGGEWKDIFNGVIAQVDLNLAFGNIALTYAGGGEKKGSMFAYVGLPISIINLDVGVGIPFDSNDDAAKQQIWAGLGLKAGFTDLIGLKFRGYAGFGGEDSDPFALTVDVMPFFTFSDSLRVFFSLGLAMAVPDEGDSTVGFNINPYIEVGQEWGPKFLAGFYLKNSGAKDAKDNTISNFGLVIGIQASF